MMWAVQIIMCRELKKKIKTAAISQDTYAGRGQLLGYEKPEDEYINLTPEDQMFF